MVHNSRRRHDIQISVAVDVTHRDWINVYAKLPGWTKVIDTTLLGVPSDTSGSVGSQGSHQIQVTVAVHVSEQGRGLIRIDRQDWV